MAALKSLEREPGGLPGRAGLDPEGQHGAGQRPPAMERPPSSELQDPRGVQGWPFGVP